jgi:hypothetical protein
MASESRKAAKGSEAQELTGSQGAAEKFLPLALAIDESAVIPFRADASLAYHNVKHGVEAVLGERGRVAKELPMVKIAEIEEAPALALGVLFASLQVNRDLGANDTIAKLLELGYAFRRKLLAAAKAFVEAGVIPAAEVSHIEAGHGRLDMAGDDVTLAALLRKYEKATLGRSPVTQEDIDGAAKVGSELQALLKPAGARRAKETPSDVAKAEETRDRLWTLLVLRHELTWRTGAWLFGKKVDERVPALQARAVSRKKETAGDGAGTGTGASGETAE